MLIENEPSLALREIFLGHRDLRKKFFELKILIENYAANFSGPKFSREKFRNGKISPIGFWSKKIWELEILLGKNFRIEKSFL